MQLARRRRRRSSSFSRAPRLSVRLGRVRIPRLAARFEPGSNTLSGDGQIRHRRKSESLPCTWAEATRSVRPVRNRWRCNGCLQFLQFGRSSTLIRQTGGRVAPYPNTSHDRRVAGILALVLRPLPGMTPAGIIIQILPTVISRRTQKRYHHNGGTANASMHFPSESLFKCTRTVRVEKIFEKFLYP